jgi:hypothetical protein
MVVFSGTQCPLPGGYAGGLHRALQRRSTSKWDMTEMPSRSHTLDSATSATIIRWGGDTLGIDYRFPDCGREVRALGLDDRLILDRLRRAGKVDYIDDDVRRRYMATLK